ncbi:MAG: GGDEF domain-containing protein [Enterocloster sp.]
MHYIRLESFERENSVLGMIADVTDDIMEKKQIERERDIDLLTGMYNRRAFYRHMEQLLREPEQLEHGMMLMADADNLKQVNDKYGHENGDRYLTAIAGLLKGCGWSNCIAARLSGDEFALFLYKCSSRNQLMEYEAGLRKTMETCTAESWITENAYKCVFRTGYAFYPEDGNRYSLPAKTCRRIHV